MLDCRFRQIFFQKIYYFSKQKKSVKTQDFQRLKTLKKQLFIEPKTRLYFGTKIQILNIQNHALLASKMGKIQTERKTSKVTRTSDVFLGFHLCLTNFLGSHLACRMLCNNFIVSRFTRIHYLHYGVKSLTQRVLSFFVFFFLTKP